MLHVCGNSEIDYSNNLGKYSSKAQSCMRLTMLLAKNQTVLRENTVVPIPAICEKFFPILHKVGTECLVTISEIKTFGVEMHDNVEGLWGKGVSIIFNVSF